MVERCVRGDSIWELSIRWRTDSGSQSTANSDAHSHAHPCFHAASARADLCAHADSNHDAPDRGANPCADTSSWALLLGWMQCMQS